MSFCCSTCSNICTIRWLFSPARAISWCLVDASSHRFRMSLTAPSASASCRVHLRIRKPDFSIRRTCVSSIGGAPKRYFASAGLRIVERLRVTRGLTETEIPDSTVRRSSAESFRWSSRMMMRRRTSSCSRRCRQKERRFQRACRSPNDCSVEQRNLNGNICSFRSTRVRSKRTTKRKPRSPRNSAGCGPELQSELEARVRELVQSACRAPPSAGRPRRQGSLHRGEPTMPADRARAELTELAERARAEREQLQMTLDAELQRVRSVHPSEPSCNRNSRPA